MVARNCSHEYDITDSQSSRSHLVYTSVRSRQLKCHQRRHLSHPIHFLLFSSSAKFTPQTGHSQSLSSASCSSLHTVPFLLFPFFLFFFCPFFAFLFLSQSAFTLSPISSALPLLSSSASQVPLISFALQTLAQ